MDSVHGTSSFARVVAMFRWRGMAVDLYIAFFLNILKSLVLKGISHGTAH